MNTRNPLTSHDVHRSDVTFNSAHTTCAGWLYTPVGADKPPVVILGHGLGGTRDMRLDAYAERFAAAGIAALAFTYRHFGDSGGQPRQLLSMPRQLADWDAAITWVKNRADLDGERIAVWGSSLGGGHAITVASRHPELRAAVSQCPFTDGLASVRAMGTRGALRMTPLVTRDLAAALGGGPPVTVPIAGPPGSVALMSTPDALAGYEALVPEDGLFVNAVLARAVPGLVAYRPGRQAKRVRPPLLVCISETDTVAPAAQTIRYARQASAGEVRTYPAGHFAFYLGAPFERIVADQTDFLRRHLHPTQRLPLADEQP